MLVDRKAVELGEQAKLGMCSLEPPDAPEYVVFELQKQPSFSSEVYVANRLASFMSRQASSAVWLGLPSLEPAWMLAAKWVDS